MSRRTIVILLVVVAALVVLGVLFGVDLSGGSSGSGPGPIGGGY